MDANVFTQQPGIHPHLLRLWGGDVDAVCEAFQLTRNEVHDDGDAGAVALWFDSDASREAFIGAIKRWPRLAYDIHRPDRDPEYRSDPHVLTRAKVTLEYKGQRYSFIDTFGYGCPWPSVEYMYTDGNYACDCNRSLFLQRRCGVVLAHDESLGDDGGDERVLPCNGEKISLVSLEDVSVKP